MRELIIRALSAKCGKEVSEFYTSVYGYDGCCGPEVSQTVHIYFANNSGYFTYDGSLESLIDELEVPS